MKKIIIGLVIICLGINLYFLTLVNKRNTTTTKEINQLKTTNDSLVKVIDSIKSDIFVKDIQLGRYEYILDRAEDEMSSKCRKELETIYGETE